MKCYQQDCNNERFSPYIMCEKHITELYKSQGIPYKKECDIKGCQQPGEKWGLCIHHFNKYEMIIKGVK